MDTERLREALVDLDRSKQHERRQRLETEAMLEGLRVVTVSESTRAMFRTLLDVLRTLLSFQDALVLTLRENGTLRVMACTSPEMAATHWSAGDFFRRLLASRRPAALFDIEPVPEWREQPAAIRKMVGSALHVPLAGGRSQGLLICTHPERAHFGQTQRNIAERYATVLSQGLLSLELRQSLVERQRFFSLSLDMMCIADFDGYFRQLSPAWESTLGFGEEELKARPFIQIVRPEDRERTLAEMRKLFAGQDVVTFENQCLCKDGSPRWLLWGAAALLEEGLYYAVARDITEQKHAERALEGRLRRLVESNIIGVVFATLDGRITDANQAFLSLIGYDRQDLRAGRLNWRDLTPAEYCSRDEHAIEELKSSATCRPWEKEYVRKDGSRVSIVMGMALIEGSSSECVCFVVDITDRRRLEEQLQRAQRMEAVGRLAGGIAHDFNNLLNVMRGYAELLELRLPGGGLTRYTSEILHAADRAAGLTHQLLAFSRKQVLKPRVMNLNGTLEDLAPLLRRMVGEAIELYVETEPGLRCVRADPAQVDQILMNLAVNARDAMPEGGRLRISTANVQAEATIAQRKCPGGVRLTVEDEGCGMTPETLDRIFEPFFTTKAPGKGNGLGLATVYGIVTQSGGSIQVKSELGRGTRLDITFPAAQGDAEERPSAASPRGSVRGKETVLLVEDDSQLRAVIRLALEQQGYNVVEAADGISAVRIGEEQGHAIELLLTDVVLPGLNGTEVARRVGQRRSGLRSVFMSGYTEDTTAFEGTSAFLAKPFSMPALLAKVREALDSKAP